MLTTQVALVPLQRQNDPDSNTELLRVAAALQTQVVRDFGPIWDVSAVVTPFLSLEDVPPQYCPIVLTNDPLPRGDHGFHLSADGRPFALVFRGERWSVTASHELMEMVLDPSGTLTVSGDSLADNNPRCVADPPGYHEQGIVDYLLEPCDPVEEADGYEIDGVPVSDFVTPAYYESFAVPGGRYSFRGAVTHPFQICEGGYLSWRVHDPANSVWQAHMPQGSSLDIGPLKDDDATRSSRSGTPQDDFVPRFSRDQVAVRTTKRGRTYSKETPAAALPNPYASSWKDYGERFAEDIGDVIRYLAASPPPTLRDVINLLEELSASGTGAAPPRSLLNKYNIPHGVRTLHGGKVAHVDEILELLREQERISHILDSNAADPDLSSWLCRLMP